MKIYTITEYDQQDYDNYENTISIDEIISNLKHIKRGYIGDYNYTGKEDDFERYKLHVSICKAVESLEHFKEEQK